MSRLPMLFAALLILVGCGERKFTSTPDEVGSAGSGSVGAVAEPTATTIITPLAPTGGEAKETAFPAPTATATLPPDGPAPSPYPTFPPVPEVASCDHAADLSVERLLIVFTPEVFELLEDPWSDEGRSPAQKFLDEYTMQLDQIREQARGLGCTDAELDELIMNRLEESVGDDPHAEQFLDFVRPWIGSPEPTPTPSPSPTEPDWTIATCSDAADVFIKRTQTLILDAFAGMAMDELEDPMPPGEAPESFYVYIYEIELLRAEFHEIGCTESEVTALIGERVDLLSPDGEVAEEIVASIRQNIDNENFFDELISDGSQ